MVKIEELEERYNELDETISRLEYTIKNCEIYKDFKKMLEYNLIEIQREFYEIEDELQKIQE